jgi:hypothetical protein
MPQKYTDDDDWLEKMAGRRELNNNDVDDLQLQLLRQKLLTRHEMLHKSVQTDPSAEIYKITSRLKKEGLFGETLIKKPFYKRIFESIPTAQPVWFAVAASLLLVVGLFTQPINHMVDVKTGLQDVYRKIVPIDYVSMFPGEVLAGNSIQITEDINTALADWEADLIGVDLNYLVKSNTDQSSIELHIKLSKNMQNLSEGHLRSLVNAPDTGEWILLLRKK